MHINPFNLPNPSPGKPFGPETGSDPSSAVDADFAGYFLAGETPHAADRPAPILKSQPAEPLSGAGVDLTATVFSADTAVDIPVPPYAEGSEAEKGPLIKESVIYNAIPMKTGSAGPDLAVDASIMGARQSASEIPATHRSSTDKAEFEHSPGGHFDDAVQLVIQGNEITLKDLTDKEALLGNIKLQAQAMPKQADRVQETTPLYGGVKQKIDQTKDASSVPEAVVFQAETDPFVPLLGARGNFSEPSGIEAGDQALAPQSVPTAPGIDKLSDLAIATLPQVRTSDAPIDGPFSAETGSKKQPHNTRGAAGGFDRSLQGAKQALNTNSNQITQQTEILSETSLPHRSPTDPPFGPAGAPRGEGSFVAAFQLHATIQKGDSQGSSEVRSRTKAINTPAESSDFRSPKAVDPIFLAHPPAAEQDAGRNTQSALNPQRGAALVKNVVGANKDIAPLQKLPMPSRESSQLLATKIPIPTVVSREAASSATTSVLSLISRTPFKDPMPQNPNSFSAEASDLTAINLPEQLATHARPSNTLPTAESAHDLRKRDDTLAGPSLRPTLGDSESSMRTVFLVNEDLGSVAMVVSGGGAHGTMVHTVGAATVAPLPVVNQVGQGLHAFIQQGTTDQLNLTLNPEEMGRVRFEMTTIGEKLHIMVFVERSETMELLRRHADHLLNDLRQSGLGQTSLNFGNWSQGGQTKGDRAFVNDSDDTAETSSLTPSFSAIRQIVADGRLDLRL